MRLIQNSSADRLIVQAGACAPVLPAIDVLGGEGDRAARGGQSVLARGNLRPERRIRWGERFLGHGVHGGAASPCHLMQT